MSWRHVRGHEVHARAFARAVARGRLAHAYLLTGAAGIGKHLFARELAKALLCEGRAEELEACDRCESCTLFDSDSHPDFFTVARPEEKNVVPIDVMRELCRGFSLKPARGRGKVALLDDADDLNDEAANCFLKTLEEPPPRSVFFLVGTSPELQLPTVVSRCQVVRMAPLSDALVADTLRENGVTDAMLLERLVRLSRGSPGQALALADPDLWSFRKTLLDGLLASQPDIIDLGKEWVKFVGEAGKDTAAQRQRATTILRLLIEFFEDALAVRLGNPPRLADPGELGALRKLADRADPDMLLAVLERCLEADVQTGRYVPLVLVLEALLDSLGGTLAAN